MTDVNDSGYRNAPPPVNLAGHFRSLARVALPALLIGILVGVSVFIGRTVLVDKQYQATAVTQITSGGELVVGDAFVEQLRAPFVTLATDPQVLTQAANSVNAGVDAGTLGKNVATSPGTSPALLSISVTASSPETASRLTQSLVTAMSDVSAANSARDINSRVAKLKERITAERVRSGSFPAWSPARQISDAAVAELQDQVLKVQNIGGNQLTLLSGPTASSTPVSPQPMQEGAVAGLIAFILAAEILVQVRGRVGRRPNPVWAQRVSTKYGAALAQPTVPPLLPSSLGRSLRSDGRGVSLVLVGNAVTVGDDGAGAARRQAPLSGRWWEQVPTDAVTDSAVVVSPAASDRRSAEEALAQLRDADIPRTLVLAPKGGPKAATTRGKHGRETD